MKTIFNLVGAAAAVAVMGLGALPASAEGIDKSKFKEGCQSGGGSYVENADGSFQCNTSDGSVKCASTTSQCVWISHRAMAGGRDPGLGGKTPIRKLPPVTGKLPTAKGLSRY